ncbi:MAG: aldo/keto reductase [Chloroflexi bacterium]|nr:aldo/keto reductase [Chloroflexota bacterium]
MEHRYLGNSGLQVSDICLGTMQFLWTTDEPNSFAVLNAYAEAGGNFVDTADVYSRWAPGLKGGEAETIIGKWMKERGNRQNIVLATKVRGRMWDGANGEGLSRFHIMRAVEESLRRLQTDTIDLYQTHSPDLNTPIEETMRAMDDLVHQGKVRYVGCSNYNGWQLMEAILTSRQAGIADYISIQPHWSLVEREIFERDVYPVVKKFNIGIIPYSPLGRGFLTGKYRRNQPPPDSKRSGSVQKVLTDKNFDLLDKIEEIARSRNKTAGQISLAWLLTKPNVTAPIIGANNVEQLKESLGATGLRLNDEEMGVLDKMSEWKRD